jgi:enoyl reductase-like protein
MTWIAACNGQRGIYQEIIMTDEERQKLCDDMREPWKLCDDVDADLAALMTRAADEIERLTAENKKLRDDDAEWDRHVDGVRRRKHYT